MGRLVDGLIVMDMIVMSGRGAAGSRLMKGRGTCGDSRGCRSGSGTPSLTGEERQQEAQGPFGGTYVSVPNWPLRRALTGALTGR